MSENTAQNSFIRVEVIRGTCYGSPALTIEINFQADGKTSTEFKYAFKKKSVAIETVDAEKFVTEVGGIVEKPEVLSDLRHVDVRYHAFIEWQNFPFINGETSGNIKAFSNERTIEGIELSIMDAETPEIAARLQQILDTKPHRHALEIYDATHKFTGKFAGYGFRSG